MSDSKRIIDSKIAGMIMALLVIVVLFVPAYASYEIEQRTMTNILAVEGLYENGTVINTYEPVNQAHVESLYFGEIKMGAEANNDSFYARTQGVNYIQYTNFVTYTGNGNYSVTPNYTYHVLPYTQLFIGVPLNITTHELAQYDFLRVTTDSLHGFHDIVYRTSFGENHLFLDKVRNNTYMIINSLSTKSQLLSAPDENIYLIFADINKADLTFMFRAEGFDLDEQDRFFWTDEHLWFGSVAVGFVIMLVSAIFTTNFVDIKFDRGKPGGKS